MAGAVSIGGCAASRHADRGHVRLATFTACVAHSHLVVFAHPGRKTGLVVTIKDRGGNALVGEVSEGRPSQILGGAAAGDGRLTMSTATPTGRSAGIIERCWDHFSPIAPDS